MHLFLCGMPASGKTTLARALAARSSLLCCDIDEHIVAHYSRRQRAVTACAEIVGAQGMAYFRMLESRCLREAVEGLCAPAIIALGSGALDDPVNRQLVQRHGKLLFLQTPLHIVLQRLMRRRPFPTTLDPLAPASSLYRLANRRVPLFLALADEVLTDCDVLPGGGAG